MGQCCASKAPTEEELKSSNGPILRTIWRSADPEGKADEQTREEALNALELVRASARPPAWANGSKYQIIDAPNVRFIFHPNGCHVYNSTYWANVLVASQDGEQVAWRFQWLGQNELPQSWRHLCVCARVLLAYFVRGYQLIHKIIREDKQGLLTFERARFLIESDGTILESKWVACSGDVQRFFS